MPKSLPPATGSVRWLPPAPNGAPRLLITTAGGFGVSQEYEVHETFGGFRLLRWEESAPGNGRVVEYFVDTLRDTCTCPDARLRRQGACKHLRGLRAALRHRKGV